MFNTNCIYSLKLLEVFLMLVFFIYHAHTNMRPRAELIRSYAMVYNYTHAFFLSCHTSDVITEATN